MDKKTSLLDNGLIWFGAGISIVEILTGTYLAPLWMRIQQVYQVKLYQKRLMESVLLLQQL